MFLPCKKVWTSLLKMAASDPKQNDNQTRPERPRHQNSTNKGRKFGEESTKSLINT
jgi:hypothetical protein